MKRNRVNVLLHGIHTINLGDDLFFRIILERYPKSRFIMYAPEIYKRILSDYGNCLVLSDSDESVRKLLQLSKILHLPRVLLIYLYIFIKYRIDIFLIVGGSLFIEGKSHIPSLVNRMRIFTKLLRIRICVIGSNFGPCYTQEFKNKVIKTISHLDDICFRDLPSYELFSKCSNVRWANDIVMHHRPSTNVRKEHRICVNIRSVDNWPSLKPYKKEYLEKVKSIIERYQKSGYMITLLSFCEKYGDNEITNELYQMLENKNGCEVMYYNGNIDDCLCLISSAEIVVATRFHAIILGLFYNASVIPISYSVKSENMLKTLGLWKDIYDFKIFSKSKFEDILENIICTFELDTNNNRQFEYIDNILN